MLNDVWVIQNSSTYLSVMVIDMPNLDPRFLNEPYSGSVPENCDLVRSQPVCPSVMSLPLALPGGSYALKCLGHQACGQLEVSLVLP